MKCKIKSPDVQLIADEFNTGIAEEWNTNGAEYRKYKYEIE